MKAITSVLMAGAVAAVALAVTVAPSEAAKKKRMAKPATCTAPATCSFDCVGGGCKINFCAGDGKWYWALLTPYCLGDLCPPKCR